MVKNLQEEVNRNGWSRFTTLLITTTLRLDTIGWLLMDKATSQVERFIGRTLRQVAEDAQTMQPRCEHMVLLGWHLGKLTHAIEVKQISELFQAVGMLAQITHWPDEVPLSFQPLSAPEL